MLGKEGGVMGNEDGETSKKGGECGEGLRILIVVSSESCLRIIE